MGPIKSLRLMNTLLLNLIYFIWIYNMRIGPPTLLGTTAVVLAVAMAAYYSRNLPRRTRQITTDSPRNLAELPEELILLIFRAVHGTPVPDSKRSLNDVDWARYNQGTRDIQNIRLTCRKFRRISSELLIKFVGVDLSLESLARLQAIMRHPTIGKGVGMIRIRLLAYDWALNERREIYVDEVRSRMNFHAEFMDPGARLLVGFYESGLRIGSESTIEKFSKAIEPGYSEFRRRYRAQSRLRKRYFIHAVAHALGMSRKPWRIEITDQDDFLPLHWQAVYRATPHNVLDLLSCPRASTWKELDDRDGALPRSFAWLVPRILAAFVDDRICITELYIDITKTTTFDHNMLLAGANSTAMQAALRNVRRFTYISRTHETLIGRGPGLSSLLYDCLPPASLQILELFQTELPMRCQWPNLTRVWLAGLRVNAHRLARFLQVLEPHRLGIMLNRCSLSGGSWADVLELLRSRQRWAWLEQPYGEEFDSFWLDLDNYEYVDPAGRHYGGVTLPERYIRGSIDVNPIRELPDYL